MGIPVVAALKTHAEGIHSFRELGVFVKCLEQVEEAVGVVFVHNTTPDLFATSWIGRGVVFRSTSTMSIPWSPSAC